MKNKKLLILMALYKSMKKCSCCKKQKPVDEFHKNKTRSDGLHPYCKECRKSKNKNDNEHLSQYKKDWYLRNRSKCLEKQKKRSLEKQSEIIQYKKKHYKDNQKEIKQKSLNYYYEHKNDLQYKNRRKDSQNKWRKKNKHVITWRSLLRTQLNRMGQIKCSSTQNMLGYSAEQLKEHIEKLWLPEMSWENHGEWHIDHIKPLYSYPKNTKSSIVNALFNLRPMWATNRVINGKFYEGNLNRKKSKNEL